MKVKLLTNRSGTALIVALLVMGVLMAISLALSALVLRESIVTREFLDAGQSYYAAESASEIGLYGVKNNLPGWQPKDAIVPIEVDDNEVAELRVNNNCTAYPCFDNGYEKSSATANAFYAKLGLNQSVTIPLFVIGKDGKTAPVTDFDVEFYAGFKPDELKIKKDGLPVSSWDILRWKIVGLKEIAGKAPLTESISDFTAVTKADDGTFTNPKIPSWFGTKACAGTGRYTDVITCAEYIIDSVGYAIESQTQDENNPQPQLRKCTQMEAREFYEYKFEDGERTNKIVHCKSLSEFINDHQLNYLTLTNLINPSVFEVSRGPNEKTTIYYRVELFNKGAATEVVRDFADITGDGYSGKSKQSVNVKIKRDSFMPVFNFSLYSTYMEKDASKTSDGQIHDQQYWYGDQK